MGQFSYYRRKVAPSYDPRREAESSWLGELSKGLGVYEEYGRDRDREDVKNAQRLIDQHALKQMEGQVHLDKDPENKNYGEMGRSNFERSFNENSEEFKNLGEKGQEYYRDQKLKREKPALQHILNNRERGIVSKSTREFLRLNNQNIIKTGTLLAPQWGVSLEGHFEATKTRSGAEFPDMNSVARRSMDEQQNKVLANHVLDQQYNHFVGSDFTPEEAMERYKWFDDNKNNKSAKYMGPEKWERQQAKYLSLARKKEKEDMSHHMGNIDEGVKNYANVDPNDISSGYALQIANSMEAILKSGTNKQKEDVLDKGFALGVVKMGREAFQEHGLMAYDLMEQALSALEKKYPNRGNGIRYARELMRKSRDKIKADYKANPLETFTRLSPGFKKSVDAHYENPTDASWRKLRSMEDSIRARYGFEDGARSRLLPQKLVSEAKLAFKRARGGAAGAIDMASLAVKKLSKATGGNMLDALSQLQEGEDAISAPAMMALIGHEGNKHNPRMREIGRGFYESQISPLEFKKGTEENERLNEWTEENKKHLAPFLQEIRKMSPDDAKQNEEAVHTAMRNYGAWLIKHNHVDTGKSGLPFMRDMNKYMRKGFSLLGYDPNKYYKRDIDKTLKFFGGRNRWVKRPGDTDDQAMESFEDKLKERIGKKDKAFFYSKNEEMRDLRAGLIGTDIHVYLNPRNNKYEVMGGGEVIKLADGKILRYTPENFEKLLKEGREDTFMESLGKFAEENIVDTAVGRGVGEITSSVNEGMAELIRNPVESLRKGGPQVKVLKKVKKKVETQGRKKVVEIVGKKKKGKKKKGY